MSGRPDADAVVRAAVAVLDRNWTGSHTLPATGLYPHQWSWDSAFIAMGLRHRSPERAEQELESLLAGQWADGRIPQIVYDPRRDDDYAPGATFWRSDELPGTPSVPTAGLVQPPNHAWAAWEVYRADPDADRAADFARRVYPPLVAWHDYLTGRRTLGRSPLACVVHPWESGMDNSPLWDEALARLPDTPRHKVDRLDLRHASAGERPSAKEYGRFFWLAEQYRDGDCQDRDDLPFLLEDPTVNTLLARSELALAELARVVGADPGPHREHHEEVTDALDALFEPALGLHVARDVTTGALVRRATVSGLTPLLLPRLPRATTLVATALGPRFLGGGALMVPSYDVTAADFDAGQYWRGPAWFNMTWLVAHGLRLHGEPGTADRLEQNLRDLALEHDFPEYVDPATGAPHGTRKFSWTAAMAIDVAVRQATS
ncbi:MGH1-like glycoside hydrolase domain-containing protein [Georgenia subflava]|uniref:Mannosylglycerate hydrolase MGH1-like glycoside hydrolase domain-containing protein n=1 Tax=Georgenia subflava TaxID=1622177 RepID=A0A6N7EFF0_9MICO|nr:hypothetical protein [Georgenia subflava]MPV36111.1 hypothetical protein [Georgenia subflava]